MPTRCRHASVQKANPLFRRPQEVTRDMDKKQGPWSRREMIERLERQDEFDVAVIGAGATGLGVALDAASRGMSVLIGPRGTLRARANTLAAIFAAWFVLPDGIACVKSSTSDVCFCKMRRALCVLKTT